MRRARAGKLGWWALAYALAAGVTWGATSAWADDDVDAARSGTAPTAASADDGQDLESGQLSGFERIRSGSSDRLQGYSARQDLLRKKTPKEITRGSDHRGKTLEPEDGPFETQPLEVKYRPTGNSQPPPVPEPTTLGLMGVGLASWIVFHRRKKP